MLFKLNDSADVCANSENLGALANDLSLDLNISPGVLQFKDGRIYALKFALRRCQIVPQVETANRARLRTAVAVASLAAAATASFLFLRCGLMKPLDPVLQSDSARLHLAGNCLHLSIRISNIVLLVVHNDDTVGHHLNGLTESSLCTL